MLRRRCPDLRISSFDGTRRWVLTEGTSMGTPHKLTANSRRLAAPRAFWALRGRTSARLAHLASMEPATSQGSHLWSQQRRCDRRRLRAGTLAKGACPPTAGQHPDALRPEEPGTGTNRIPGRTAPAISAVRDRSVAGTDGSRGPRSAPAQESAMSGRPRTAIGTYGAIHVTRKRSRTYVARTRYRDIDGRLRDVTATAESRNRAIADLKDRLLKRPGYGQAGVLSRHSPFGALAERSRRSRDLRGNEGELPRRPPHPCPTLLRVLHAQRDHHRPRRDLPQAAG